MKNILKFFLIAILLILGSGCATTAGKLNQEMHAAAAKGDYQAMEQKAELLIKEMGDRGRVSAYSLVSDDAHNPVHTIYKKDAIGRLCAAYSDVKNYEKIFQCLDRWDKAIDEQEDSMFFKLYGGDASCILNRRIVAAHLSRAQALLDLGEYPKALENAKMAYGVCIKQVSEYENKSFLKKTFSLCPIELYREYVIRSISTLAIAYAMNDNKENAFKYINLLKEFDVGFKLMGNRLQPLKYTELTKAYIALGDYKTALEMIQQEKAALLKTWDFVFGTALGVGFAFLGQSNMLFAGVQAASYDPHKVPREFMISKCQFENRQVEDAKTTYDQLLEEDHISKHGNIYWTVLSDRGKIAENEKDIKKAVDYYKKSIDVIEAQRSTINTEASRIGFVGDKQKTYHRMISALYSDKQHGNAFEYVERSKSRALVDVLASKKDFAADKTVALKELEEAEMQEKALSIIASPEDKTTDKDKPVQTAQLTPQSTQRTVRSVTIKEKIKTEMPELSSLVTVSVPLPTEIQSYIQSDETLIEYYYHGEDLYAFVLTKNELKAVKLEGKELVSVVEDFRKSLQDPKSNQYLELSQKLYQRLIKPVEHLISTQRLIIVPHGVLHYLPFNALNSGGNYLIDKYSISYLPSASVMKFLKQRKTQKTESALIFGNPDLDDPKYDLKFAGDEAVAISKEFSKAKVFLRKDATKTNFKKTANQFNYIHFATHGMFESDSPLKSGLFLSKGDKNDGLLTVDELYSLQLNADLVTLSACETGLGKVKHGDDVVGLTRGFLYAGANSIVASLWKVDDLATSQLMTGFYANLKKTNKRDALREAQLAIKKQFEHPYYWAAFQLTGMAE